MDTGSISWKRTPFGDGSANFEDLSIYMGLCETDELGDDFMSNYMEGTGTLVFETDQLTVSAGPDEWAGIVLDAPYWYGGEHNLVIEVTWSDGSGSFYVYGWSTGGDRALEGGYGAGSGLLSREVPHMLLTGALALHETTFGRVKAFF